MNTTDTETIYPAADSSDVIHVDYWADPKDGPMVRLEVEELDEGYRAAYLTPAQARALAAALHVYAYRATAAALAEADR